MEEVGGGIKLCWAGGGHGCVGCRSRQQIIFEGVAEKQPQSVISIYIIYFRDLRLKI